MKNYKFCWLLIAMVSIACEVLSGKEQEKQIAASLPSEEFLRALDKITSPQLIDIRTPEEYKAGHLKSSRLINFYDNDFKEQILKLSKNDPVYFYCKSGGRSAEALKIFQEAGFLNLIELKGGITQWQNSGFEVEK